MERAAEEALFMLEERKQNNMNRKSLLGGLAVAQLLLAFSSTASAIETSYRISFDANVSSNGGVSGALVNPPQTSQGTRDLAFTLDDNQSFTWNVFALYVSGYPLLTADNVPVSATVYLENVSTHVVNQSLTFGGAVFLEHGIEKVVWSTPPQTIAEGPTSFTYPELGFASRTFTVGLADQTFDYEAIHGAGIQYAAEIPVIISQLSSSATVPDSGSTALLLGGGLVAIALVRRAKAHGLNIAR